VFLSPSYADDKSNLQAWRERILSANLFIIASLGTIGYIAFLISDIIRGFQDPSYWAEIPVNTLGYLLIVSIAFGRRLPFKLRATSLISILALVAFSDKLHAGLGGVGELLLLTLAILMAVFFGAKGGAIAIGLNVAILAIPGWLMLTGRKALPSLNRIGPSGRAPAWILTTLVLVVCSLMIIVSAGMLMQGVTSRLSWQDDLAD